MTWQAIGVMIAMLGVIATFVLNLRSQKLTREGQRQDRELAGNAASRSEAAARLTEEYTRRVVDALEAIAIGTGSVPAASVAWELVQASKDGYRLTNVGQATAHRVLVAGHESLGGLINLPEEPADLQPGEALAFYAGVTFGTTDLTITVAWLDDDGIEHTWRYPLPFGG